MAKTSASKSLTRAEIQRRYRERKQAENSELYLQKERERWYQRCDKKTVKVINDCTEREKRIVRRKWRERTKKHRIKKKRDLRLKEEIKEVEGENC
jgi:GT2 family glycosyltransferase